MVARAYTPRDPNRPAEWVKLYAGISTHPRTLYLGQLVGCRHRARGLVLAMFDVASRSPIDGRVFPADLFDPVTFDFSREDMDALVKSGWLTQDGSEYVVRSWGERQGAIIRLRQGGAKGGKAGLKGGSDRLEHASSLSSPLSSSPSSSSGVGESEGEGKKPTQRTRIARQLGDLTGKPDRFCRKAIRSAEHHGMDLDWIGSRIDADPPYSDEWPGSWVARQLRGGRTVAKPGEIDWLEEARKDNGTK